MSLATLRREVTVINATVDAFKSALNQSSEGSNCRVISVHTGPPSGGGVASYKRRQHQRDDRQVSVRSGCLDVMHVSATSVVLLWGETGRGRVRRASTI